MKLVSRNLYTYTENITYFVYFMVFILDGCSIHYAHTWSESGISICLRHLVTSKDSSPENKIQALFIHAQHVLRYPLIQVP